ncbi:MAG: diaminopimelate decarboxylase [Fusobacteriaceae bacterium]
MEKRGVMRLFGTMKNNDGILSIGGISVEKLAQEFKTPLYIMDCQLIEENIKKFKSGFKSNEFKTEIVYASKAFLSKTMCKILQKYDLDIDAITTGELYTIQSSGFPMEKVHMHGNNKSEEELLFCLENGVGSIILDNFLEIKRLSTLAKKIDKKIKVMLRINIGIDAHTHEYIKTSKHSSKFGISIFGEDIYSAVEEIIDSNNLEFLGFHCHIGSQIFDEMAFLEAGTAMIEFSKKISEKFSILIPEINLGGGFGVYYTEEDSEIDIESFMKKIITHIESQLKQQNYSIKKLSIEPGRSIVANAGSTLYTVGESKVTFSGEKYVFVDGGMGDNLRPALYQAKYEAVIANKMDYPTEELVNIAGKCCESGDILIKNISLQKSVSKDLLLIPTTGAYGYSMSNNYNKLVRPGVVFVKDGKAYVSIQRESYEDLIKNDLNTDII